MFIKTFEMDSPRCPIFTSLRRIGNEVFKAANDYCDYHVKLAKAKQQLNFNLRCKRTNIIPKSLQMRPPIQTQEAIRYFKDTVSK